MISIPLKNTETLTILRRRWLLTAAIYSGLFLFAYLSLRAVWPYATRWAVVASIVLGHNLWVLWRWLPHNHREGESILLPTLGLGNILTLGRGLAIALLAGFIFSPSPEGSLAWGPMWLYTGAIIADYFDGYLARLTNHTTLLGAKLDMEFDGLGMLLVILLAVWYRQLPWWYLSIGLARYLFVFGLWWRERLGQPVYDLPPSVHRSLFAGWLMGFMTVALWPILPADGVTLAGLIFFTPTAISFLRDWFVVIGRLDANSSSYQKIQRWLYLAFAKWGILLLRLALFITMIMIYRALPLSASIGGGILQPPTWVELLTSGHLPWAGLLASVVAVIAIVCTISTTLGIAGRLSSFLLAFPIGFDVIINGLQWHNAIALISISSIVILGTGFFSLWQPENTFLMRRGRK